MGTNNNDKRAADLIRKSYTDKLIKVDFEIPLPGETKGLKASLSITDYSEITSSIRIAYTKAHNEYKVALGNTAVDKHDLKAYLDALPNNIRREEEKDEIFTQAQLLAKKKSQESLYTYILPKFIRDEKGRLMFPTQEEQDIFREAFLSNLDLNRLMIEKFAELFKKINDTKEEAKNS